VVEKLQHGGQMLFDRRLGHPGAELLNVSDYGRRPDSVQRQAAVLAPIEALPWATLICLSETGANFCCCSTLLINVT
jgi:hypothetical protein